MVKRLLDCTASEICRFNKKDLLASIAGCEGRVLACETIGITPPLLADCTICSLPRRRDFAVKHV